MDASSIASHNGEKRRSPKSLRRACWECKKPRIQASASVPDVSSLRSFKADRKAPESEKQVHYGERLCKLEQLLEKFVCRKFSEPNYNAATESNATIVSSNEKSPNFGLPKIPSDAQSISSIGDGILGAQSWSSAPAIRTLQKAGDREPGMMYDAVQRSLVSLLPSQGDANIIFESSNGWMILGGIYQASQDIYVNQDPQSYALDMGMVKQERAIIVARTLLHLAICIYSLPPEFDQSRLSDMWCLETTAANYISTVTSLVTNSDELMLTLHGLETLLLLALCHMSSANFRQSWLVIRRGLTLAHLMGFHRIVSQPDVDPPIAAITSAKMIWRTFVAMDRYIGLYLRLPFAADDYPLADDADLQQVHRWKIVGLTRKVAELDQDISPQAYAAALALDEKLESTMNELPKEFWDVPNVPPTARSPESYAVIDRLMVQVWHFEMKIFIHLPYLLRAPRDGRYEYSRVTALQACRNMIMRWFALRNASITQACCRFAELGVFLAAVTLTLDIVIELSLKEKCEVQKTKTTDFAMICRLISEMEKLGKASWREKIAGRSATVLKKILSTLDPRNQSVGKARLTLPFFGTIDLEYKKPPARASFNIESETGRMMGATASGHRVPVFSFVSNALWPASSEGECDLDWDIVLFDGLEDRDTEGNWMF